MSKVQWLCVGTGDIVKKRAAAALASADGGKLVGVCGGRERAQAIADEHGAPEVYDDLDQALKETTADTVYVGTPVYRHGDEAVRAIEAGKHILVEKPLGLSGDDAQQIADAAKAAGVTAGCAYYRRTFPSYRHLKQLINDKALGRLVLVRTCYWGWFSPTPDDPKLWRVQKDRSGGGPLMDMGSHMFDIMIGLLGLPKTVFAHCATLVQDYEVEDSSAITMTYEDGLQVVAHFGWNSKTWSHEFEIVGSEAKVKWSPADAQKVVVTRGRDIDEVETPLAANVHEPLVADFNAAVAGGHDPICPIAEAVRTNRVLDAIYRSSTERRIVEL